MQTSTRLFAILLLLFTSAACSKKAETHSGDTDSSEWTEMEDFHLIMAEAYHPFKDSSNVEPVKRLAEEMAQEAGKWQAAPLPVKMNNDQVKSQLEKLKADTRALADQIKAGAKDEEIGTALEQLHESFHAIMEAWHQTGEKHPH